jgi:phosphohistidine phosphatase
MSSHDLVLWRHADAGESGDGDEDLLRPLTAKGEKQAARMATWLRRQLPESTRVICSPATRAEQTAMALQRPYKLRKDLDPSAHAQDLLGVAQWGQVRSLTLIVGHQPALGTLIANALVPNWSPGATLSEGLLAPVSVRKGALWWLRLRQREGQSQVVVVCVQTPELL